MSIHQAGWATCDLRSAHCELRSARAEICELWVASAAEQLINKWNGNNNAGPWPQHAPLTVTSSFPVGCAGKLRARTTKFTILWESGGWWCDAIREMDGDGDGDGDGGQTWTDSSWHCGSAKPKPKPNEDASAQLIETKKKGNIHTHTRLCSNNNNNEDMRQLTWQHKVAAATKKQQQTAALGNGKLQWKGNCRASLMNVMATRSRHD